MRFYSGDYDPETCQQINSDFWHCENCLHSEGIPAKPATK